MKKNLIGMLFFILILAGCAPAPKVLPTPTAMTTTPTLVPTPVSSDLTAIILVEEGYTLEIHLSAGENSAIIESLSATAVDIPRTGREELLGEELWVEIKASTGQPGWVNARYLTEYVPETTFCSDTHIPFLLDELKIALENKDGDLFSSLVSPKHGLDLRYYRYGALANYTPAEAAWAFSSEYAVDWGDEPGSGFEKIGTFSEIPLPMLLEVFGANHELYCNEVGIAATFAPEPWPSEYSNINFYQIFKSGTEQYAGMDWRSWLVGVEYIKGEPYLFSLLHFQWTP